MNYVQSMWVGNKLGRMQTACIRSFLKNGYKYHLYVYDRISDIPKGTTVLDGNEILSRDKIKLSVGSLESGGGSHSGFSDHFRFKLLKDRGGTWVDTDIYCLRKLPETEYIFVREQRHVASCIIRCPKNCQFANMCFNVCESKNLEKISWGEIGPILVTKTIQSLRLGKYIQAESLYFPVVSGDIEKFFENTQIPFTSYTLHFWNEMWRRKGVNKEDVFQKDTLYERLIENSLLPVML